MKNKREHFSKGAPSSPGNPQKPDETKSPQPEKFPEHPAPERREWTNPYPWFPAIGQGEPGNVHISLVIVYYSLN